MPAIELGKEREQLCPGMKEKPQMLDSCFNTVRFNILYCTTSKLYRLHRATRGTRLMGVTVQEERN